MKSALLTALNTIEIRDIPKPEPGEGEVLCRVGSVGVCASDVHYYEHGCIGSNKVIFPQGLGHEPSGIVEEAGPGADASLVGKRVAIEPAMGCEKCEFCLSDRENLCTDMVFFGSPGIPGAYQEYVTVPARNVFPIPDSMTLAEGAMLEPFCVGIEAALISGLKEREGASVCVFGAGPIGLSTIAAVKAMGCGTLYVVEPLEWRRKAAVRDFNADKSFDNSGSVEEWIKDETGGRGVDLVFEASGQNDVFPVGVEVASRGGTFVVIGIPPEDTFSFNAHTARHKGLTIVNDRRSNRRIEIAFDIHNKGKAHLDKLVSHTFSLEQTADALDIVRDYGEGVIKAVVEVTKD